MKKILFLLSALLLLGSCYHENTEKVKEPDPLFSPTEMAEILTDLQLAEAVVARNRIERKHLEKAYKDSVYRMVFEHYDITKEQLLENINYYNSKPKRMEKIYNKVLSNLSRIQTELEVEVKKEKQEEKQTNGK
ncbi:MAG: DUF4296 domain-containing protein [Chlorobi bacterium]|nr:DUF4296 domain-containing protein [Chlorobiota bacterium]